MVNDEELDKFVEDDLQKDINQTDSIDPSVEAHLMEMGFLWDRVQKKLHEDNTCFKCKNVIIEDEKTTVKSYVLQLGNTEKGVAAFCSLCKKCYNEEMDKNAEKQDSN